MGSGGGKKGGGARVTEYRIGLHYGICHGPVDSLNKLYFGEKEGWAGDLSLPGVIDIYRQDFHGGETSEGGINGYVYFLPGDSDQLLPALLADKLGLIPTTAPGYRGTTTLWFTGVDFDGNFGPEREDGAILTYADAALNAAVDDDSLGFSISHNNPYLKTIWAEVTRLPTSLASDFSRIDLDEAPGQANPAHMIYEAMTDTTWGSCTPAALIKTDSFLSAAETLFNESFGMSMGWFQQTTLEDIVKDIQSHIQAMLYVNREDGLWTLKLLRDDYDPDTLPVFDETNCRISKPERKLPGETINEIVVKYTSPESEDPVSISLQDLAGVFAQGGEIITTTHKYPGIWDSNLAAQVLARDLRAASAPLASATLLCSRDAWNLSPGAVIRVNYVEHCMNGVIFRVMDVDYGKDGDPEIKVKILEDIFGFSSVPYFTPPITQWDGRGQVPEPIAFTQFHTLPAFLALAGNAELELPETHVIILATHPPRRDTSSYAVRYHSTLLNGDATIVSLPGTYPFIARTTLPDAIPAEAESIVEFTNVAVGGRRPRANSFLVIGEGGDEDCEIAFVTEFQNLNAQCTLRRGALDTVPRAWPAETVVWVLHQNSVAPDQTVRTADVPVTYRLLPQTSLGFLPLAAADELEFTPGLRPHLPNRPADVRINDIGFATDPIDLRDATGVTATWATRNRLLEETTVLAWTDAPVTPEVGQTTVVETFTLSGVSIARHEGVVGDSYAFDFGGDFAGYPVVRVRVTALRDDLESLQGHELDLRVATGGWGFDWSFNWGGGSGST